MKITKEQQEFIKHIHSSSGVWDKDIETKFPKLFKEGRKEDLEALIKEIKKRGLWDTPIKCIFFEGNWNNDKKLTRFISNEEVWTEYGMVFQDGVFADKLETITKQEAEKQLGKIIE